MSETKPRRQYTEEFKTEAVRLVREAGKPIAQLARELGISANLLYRRRGEEHRARSLGGATRAVLKADAEELVRLKRELETVKKERDFLKSAAAYFARERK
jgi:transposase